MVDNVFVDLSRLLVVNKDYLPHTVWLCANIASLELSAVGTRQTNSPNYISDLGLRTREDPRIYLSESIKPIGINLSEYESMFSVDDFYNSWVNEGCDSFSLIHHFDVLVNFAGQWDTAAALSRYVWENNNHNCNYVLLTYLASCLSVEQDSSSGDIYEYMLKNIANCSVVDCIMTRIRFAAWLIKRKDLLRDGIAQLYSNIKQIKDAVRNYRLSHADGVVLECVTDNLLALAFLKQGLKKEAINIIDSAYSRMHFIDGQVVTKIEEALRFRQQITINKIQLQVLDGKFDEAYILAKDYLSWVESRKLGYESEATILLSYLEYLRHNYRSAIKFANLSLGLSVSDGSIKQVALIRKLLIASYYECKDYDSVESILSLYNKDPAGFLSIKN